MANDEMVELVARIIHDTDDMADTVWPSHDNDDGYRGGNGYVRLCRWPEVYRNAARNALEAVAPAIRAAAMEEAAVLVETHTYTNSNREPFFSLQPSQRAKDDMHHRTIAAAIRSAKEVK